MDPNNLYRLQAMISRQTGLHLRETELVDLDRYVENRVATLRLPQSVAFIDRLAADPDEWRALVATITTGESYFLRDQGQMTLLRTQILPDLLARRSRERTLSIWSAGCSTGEEVYSLAILLDQIATEENLDLADWSVTLLGTDLNDLACRRAKTGDYGNWSFRGVPAAVQTRYFTRHGQGWRVVDSLRRHVHFRPLNLLEDAYPPARSVDLILCRNVLIYFTPEAISTVIDKLSQTLRGDGYLITGHGELQGVNLGGLVSQVLPNSVVYRPRPTAPARTATLPHPPTGPVPSVSSLPLSPWPLPGAATLSPAPTTDSGRTEAPVRAVPPAIQRSIRAATQEKLDAAQVHANAGRLQQAESLCRQAVDLEPLAPLPHYLLAHIAQEKADVRAARTHYQKALYLDPDYIPALLELSLLLDQPQEAARARHLRRTALDLLLALPSEQPITPYAETAGQLLAQWPQDERQSGS